MTSSVSPAEAERKARYYDLVSQKKNERIRELEQRNQVLRDSLAGQTHTR
jgi:hypothetical protein